MSSNPQGRTRGAIGLTAVLGEAPPARASRACGEVSSHADSLHRETCSFQATRQHIVIATIKYHSLITGYHMYTYGYPAS
jgi:hypothetical protein